VIDWSSPRLSQGEKGRGVSINHPPLKDLMPFSVSRRRAKKEGIENGKAKKKRSERI